jgi:hypothetical protein
MYAALRRFEKQVCGLHPEFKAASIAIAPQRLHAGRGNRPRPNRIPRSCPDPWPLQYECLFMIVYRIRGVNGRERNKGHNMLFNARGEA